MKKTNKVLKVASIVGAGALIIGATIGGAIMYNPVDIPSIKNQSFNNGVASIDQKAIADKAYANGVSSVEPIVKYVNVTKEVVVNHTITVTDDTLIKATCDRLLFDDVAQCQKEVMAEQDALETALKVVKDNDFFYKLETKNIVADKDKAEVIKVYDDFEDITIVKSNYDDNKYVFKFDTKVEDLRTDDKKKVEVKVTVEDGDVDFRVSEI